MNFCSHKWGLRLKKRLSRVETWAEKQGLELAADCHLARIVQAAHLLLSRKNTAEDIVDLGPNPILFSYFNIEGNFTKVLNECVVNNTASK